LQGSTELSGSQATPSPPASADGPVELPTFAAVSAALADGFEEGEVLAHHDVPQESWPIAKTTWTRRLVDEGQDGPLFSEYRTALHKREDELGRDVEPIDRDLPAWLGFVAATQAEDPAALFARTGLRLPDLSRLSRAWSARLEADSALRTRAEESRAAGVAPEVPPLRLGKSSLFGKSPSPPDKLPQGPTTTGDFDSFEEVSVAEYVAVMARIERPENLLLSVLRTKLIPPKLWEQERARIEEAMAGDPVFRREVGVLMSFERSRLDIVRAERSPSVPPPAPTQGDVWNGGDIPASYADPSSYAYTQALQPQHTPSYALPAALQPQHTPSYALPAALQPQHTPSYALPAAGHAAGYGSQAQPHPETPYLEQQPPSVPSAAVPVFSFHEAAPVSAPRAEAYAFEPPQDEAPYAEQFQDEGTCLVDLDEATSFQLPFALPVDAGLPFAVHAEPAAVAATAAPAAAEEALPISLEDHARLHVELNAGFSEAEVLSRYGLAWDARPRADAMIEEWKRRDQGAADTWLAAYQAHVIWLLQEDGADA